MKILVIIPAYNEAENIPQVISRLKGKCPQVDYLIINDCSNDNTEKVCKSLLLNYISLPVNLGIGGGVQTGYKYAVEKDYDIVIQHDGDGQHDPNYLTNVIEPILNKESDIVIGSRFINKEGFQSSLLRRAGILFLSKLIKCCCGANVKDVTSGFRAVNKKYISFYAQDYPQDYPEPEAIVAAQLDGARIKEVPVVMNERINGESSISSFKSIYYMIKVSLAVLIYRIIHSRRGT